VIGHIRNFFSRKLRLYELLLRAWKSLEDRRRPRSGLSLVALAQKP